MDGFKELQGGNRGGNLQRNGKFHSDLERKREEKKKRKKKKRGKTHRKKEKTKTEKTKSQTTCCTRTRHRQIIAFSNLSLGIFPHILIEQEFPLLQKNE